MSELSLYECVFIMRQDIPVKDVHDATESFLSSLVKNGFVVKLKKQEYWGIRTLAHIIKKNRKGHYMMLNLEAHPSAIIELERNFRISEDVLRYLTMRIDSVDENPSAMMSAPADIEPTHNTSI